MKIAILFLIFAACIFGQNSYSIKRDGRLLSDKSMKNIDDVISHYENLQIMYSDSFQIYDDLAFLYSHEKKIESAISQYKMIMSRFPEKYIYSAIETSLCYDKIGKRDSAIIVIKNAYKYCTDCSSLDIMLANLYLFSGEFEYSFEYFGKTNLLDSKANSITLNNYAYVCSVLDTNLNQAESIAKLAISKSNYPENFYLYETLGDIQVDLKKYKEALNSYERFIEVAGIQTIQDKVDNLNNLLKEK